MEARLISAALLAAAVVSLGASHRTQNFVATAPSQQLATEVCEAAEVYRRDLAIQWLGKELPPWREPCPIQVTHVGPNIGAGGATSFMFERGRPFGWTMSIQGSHERLVDAVLPHEVTHTIFATHFGGPLPRWADEGACTTVEHESERYKQERMLIEFLTTARGIAFNRMFTMTEYPHDVLPLYSQGYSLARFLIAQGGRPKFIRYIGDGMGLGPENHARGNTTDLRNWNAATQKHYGYQSLSELQVTWLDWVRRGSPAQPQTQGLLASTEQAAPAVGDLADYHASDAEKIMMSVQPVGFNGTAAPGDGWYAKRSAAAPTASGVQLADQGDLLSPAPAYAPGSIKTAPPLMQTLSRPQPIGHVQETIIDPGHVMPSPPATASNPASGSYYDAPANRGGTMWR